MDSKIENGDIVCSLNGNAVAVKGFDEIFQRAYIRMKCVLNSFIYDRRLGSEFLRVEKDDVRRKEKIEMLLNESIAEIYGGKIVVNEIKEMENKAEICYSFFFENQFREGSLDI